MIRLGILALWVMLIGPVIARSAPLPQAMIVTTLPQATIIALPPQATVDAVADVRQTKPIAVKKTKRECGCTVCLCCEACQDGGTCVCNDCRCCKPCRNKRSAAMDARPDFEVILEQAVKEGKPLVVFVAQDGYDVPECKCVSCESFPGVKNPGVVVMRPNKTLVYLPGTPATITILRTAFPTSHRSVQPSVTFAPSGGS